MKRYDNLPPEQRPAQRLADQFNADERLWRRLASKRKRRRKNLPFVSAELHRQLDLLEFALARPPQDAIGEREDT
jgi:hypothetical protein